MRTENTSSAEIQRELDFMRAMYAERRSLNHPRHEAMVGWCLVGLGVAVPVVAALMVILF
jgi:hypothetical protein